MRNPEQVLNILAGHSNEPEYKYERLYRILFNEQMFFAAYQRMYAKPGNMTPGTDGKTEDEMSIDRINKLIESIKDETYSPNPAKRTYIPKKNVCLCVCERERVTLLHSRKLTEHCKSTIMEKIKIINKETNNGI